MSMKRLYLTIVATGLMASACTSAPEEVAESTTTPTTAASTTTVEATTTTEAVSDEEAVLAAHTAFMTEFNLVDEVADGYEPFRVAAAEFTTGGQTQAVLGFSEDREADSEFLVSPGYVSNIVEFAIEGDVANVWDCSQDRGELLDLDGNVLTPADDFFKIRQTRVERVDGVWLIADFNTGGDVCDPTE